MPRNIEIIKNIIMQTNFNNYKLYIYNIIIKNGGKYYGIYMERKYSRRM